MLSIIEKSKMVSFILVLAVAIINQYWLFPKFRIEGKLLKSGITMLISGLILSVSVKLFGISVVSLRYGVKPEVTSDTDAALFATLFTAFIGLLFVLVGISWPSRNA